jgi:hypothetical protein
MGQSKWAILCAFLLTVVPSDRLFAQRAVTVTSTPGDAEQRIERMLAQRLKAPIEFVDTPLTTIFNVIAEEYDLSILFDKTALESVAINPDTEISTNLRNITLRSAMDLMLAEVPDLTYIVDNEVLLITSQDEASTRLEVRVYRVDDLISEARTRANQEENRDPFAPIIDVIANSVERHSWQCNNTGEGEIRGFSPGMLVISQTRRVHQQIVRLLEVMRAVKDDIKAEKPIAEAPPAEAAETTTATEPARKQIPRAATPVAENGPFGGF